MPMPLRTMSTLAPTRSQRLAMSFMNEMRVASMALAVYLVSSDEARSMNSMRSPVIMKGRYSSLMMARARSLSTPMMTRSGIMKSLTA